MIFETEEKLCIKNFQNLMMYRELGEDSIIVKLSEIIRDLKMEIMIRMHSSAGFILRFIVF